MAEYEILRNLSVMDSVPMAMWGCWVETKLSSWSNVAGLRLLIKSALAPSTPNLASRAVSSNSYANVTISLSPCFIKLSPIFRWVVLQPNLSYMCSSIPFQLT
jgi:hypothetical protein